MLIDPEKTTWTRRQAGRQGLSLKTWQGDQWKIGGGTTWGWYSYDPELNLIYYGTGNPRPGTRAAPGDNKWSMTIFARDADTGMAKWVYQMTPHDEWDYDGVNEMILADINGQRQADARRWSTSTATASATRSTAPPASCWSPRSTTRGELGDHVDMKTGRPQVVAQYSTQAERRGQEHQGHLPGGARLQGPAAGGLLARRPACSTCRPTTSAWTTSRSRSSYTAGQPYVGATLSMYPAAGRPRQHGQLHRLGRRQGKIVVEAGEVLGLVGALATAGDIAFYGTLEGYLKAVDAKDGKELFKFKTPSGIIGNVNTYSTTASSTSACSRASAAGPASAWRPAWTARSLG
jgi:glucose dehydrogenase